jgi:hypothetical protein
MNKRIQNAKCKLKTLTQCVMLVICYMSVICLVLGGVVRVRLYIIYAHLCNHIRLQKWWWDLGHSPVHS